jgi:hypothetical protein
VQRVAQLGASLSLTHFIDPADGLFLFRAHSTLTALAAACWEKILIRPHGAALARMRIKTAVAAGHAAIMYREREMGQIYVTWNLPRSPGAPCKYLMFRFRLIFIALAVRAD